VTSGVVLATGDAHVLEYRRTFDALEIAIVLWDESVRRIRAEGVVEVRDTGTWECDGLIRYPDLDGEDVLGYAIVDTDDMPTLIFNARNLVL
jgi:hypothetical protein